MPFDGISLVPFARNPTDEKALGNTVMPSGIGTAGVLIATFDC